MYQLKFSVFLIFLCFSFFLSYAEYDKEIGMMIDDLSLYDVPSNWVSNNISNNKFTLYKDIHRFFNNMAENKVKKHKKDVDWYMRHFGVDQKIVSGRVFIEKNRIVLEEIEKRFGIPKELVVSILAIESNFGDKIYKGNFYVFNTLVSQYVFLEERRSFAIRQLYYIYKFQKKTNHDIFYFIGSFAGASGWGQFIPSSLYHFFLSYDDDYNKIDLYDMNNNIISIANYLYENGLEGKEFKNEDIYKAIYAYNRSDAYVKAVMYIYEGLLL